MKNKKYYSKIHLFFKFLHIKKAEIILINNFCFFYCINCFYPFNSLLFKAPNIDAIKIE